jgi:hypothetical protein
LSSSKKISMQRSWWERPWRSSVCWSTGEYRFLSFYVYVSACVCVSACLSFNATKLMGTALTFIGVLIYRWESFFVVQCVCVVCVCVCISFNATKLNSPRVLPVC